jgi:hypothetical protein
VNDNDYYMRAQYGDEHRCLVVDTTLQVGWERLVDFLWVRQIQVAHDFYELFFGLLQP